MRHRLIILIVLIGLCGCNSQQEVTPLPEPEWIQSVPRNYPQDGATFILSGETFWSPGYEANEMYDYLSENLTMRIDSVEVPEMSVMVDALSLAPRIVVYDDQQNLLGSYREEIEVYMFFLPETPGTYRIDLSIPSTSGEIYSYSWDLVVADA